MYIVTIYDGVEDTEGTVIHTPYASGLKSRFDIDLVASGISSMELTISRNNPAFNGIRPYQTLVKVESIKTGKIIFEGRFLKSTHIMSSDGVASLAYLCEGLVAYLHDSNQRWAKVQNTTIRSFLESMINVHNQQVEPHKQFVLGKVTVQNNTDNVYRYVGYASTYEEIKDNLIDRLGGYLVVRKEADGLHLDYLAEIGELKSTPIRLRSDLKDFRREIDPTEVITRLIPLGERLESENEEEYNASEPRLDMKSVNNGIDHLDDSELIAEFGIKEGTLILDDVTQASFLKLRAEQFFENQKAAKVSYSVNVANLYLIDESFEEFEVGNYHPISVSPLLEVEDTLQIIGIKINSENPQINSLVIGEQFRTTSQYRIEISKRTRNINDIHSEAVSTTRRVRQLREELTEKATNLQNQIDEIDISDIPEIQETISNLSVIVDQLTIVIGEIPEPIIYERVTETTDGLMSYPDKQKLNRIIADQPIDLDQFMADFLVLKEKVEEFETNEEE